jgi:integrase/recombinase XerD
MRDPSRVRVSGPLACYADGFCGELAEGGYSRGAAAVQLQVMGHLSGWLARRGLDGSGLTAAVVDAYLAERRSTGCASHWSRRALAPLLGFLQQRDVAPVPGTSGPEAGPVEALLGRYARWLASERGLAETTIQRNVGLVRPLVAGLRRADRVELEHLAAGDVTAFVVAQRQDVCGGTPPRMVTALRSLLRFLHVEGFIDQPLVSAVPPVATWKLAGLPQALQADQVAALLGSCDPATVVGRRDLAILQVLVRLGLRAGEAAALRLDDIDWRRGELTVCGKGNRHDRLPLPADVGQAIVAYLIASRRPTTSAGIGRAGREVFVTVKAPQRALTRGAVTQVVARGAVTQVVARGAVTQVVARGAVTQVVARAARRADLGPIYAHRLRHTAATGMLRAGGSLTEIGQVLRHRHTLTTAIYAKVDIEALRLLARPWPTTPGAA